MKVKESLNISNKKKNALPTSKLLKPKKFKTSLKKSGEGKNPTLSKDKLKLVHENINLDCDDSLELMIQGKSSKKEKTMKNSLGLNEKSVHARSPKKSRIAMKESGTLSSLFDFFTSKDQKLEMKHGAKDKRVKKKSVEKNQSSKTIDEDQNKENETTVSDKQKLKARKTPVTQEQNKKEKVIGGGLEKRETRSEKIKNKSSENKQLYEVVKDQNTGNDLTAINKCKLKASKVAAVTKGLLKIIDENSSNKPEILDVGEPVFLQVECVKIPICPTKQLRFKLPHPLVDETSDVLLITADLKGHKIYPDKAVEHYEELLAKLGINFINKVMPLRMVKKEYSQYEMKRKLVDQFDVILADSRIIKSLPTVLGKFALYKRKMPVPVNLRIGERKLRRLLQDAVHKTQLTVKSNGHCSVVQVGHSKMAAREVAANVVHVAQSLETLYPGGWRNVRSLAVRAATSTALPVYLSLISPNEVKIPVEVRRRPKPVEGELSTMPGYNVLVTADGNVVLKKVEEELKIDNSRDDEILEEAEKYLEASKTVRYDESSDEEKNEEKDSESDDEGEAITEAMEKKLMNKYEKHAKGKKNKKEEEDEDDDEEEEEEGSEDESEVVPVTGKKRKSQGIKKQSGPVAKKAFSAVEPKGKAKGEKPGKDNKTTASPGLKKQQKRGTRGGKKNKLSKDQRKALIKRKKAGKK